MDYKGMTLNRTNGGHNICSRIVGNTQNNNIGCERSHMAEIISGFGPDWLRKATRMSDIAAAYRNYMVAKGL